MSEIDFAKYLFRKAFQTPSSMDPPYQKSMPTDLPVLGFSSGAGVGEDLPCGICKRVQTDHRVLACFHSFCLSCLQEYQHNSPPRTHHSSGSQGNISIDSGTSTYYDGDVAADHYLRCPACDFLSKLPAGGVSGLPPHYVLHHKILLASLNRECVSFFCDLCSTDIPALSRCSECLVNMCTACLDIHSKQPRSASHEVNPLSSTAHAGNNSITAVKRTLMCSAHPDSELSLYCSDCQHVVCRSCCALVHRGHAFDVVERTSKTYSVLMKQRLEKAKLMQRQANQSLDTINSMAHRIQTRCAQVEAEIDQFIDGYISALQEHRSQLRAAVAEARTTKLNVLEHHKQLFVKASTRGQQPLTFGEELLAEGSPAEILVFAVPLITHLQASGKSTLPNSLPDLKALETINLLPDEKSAIIFSKQMYGVVTTQRVSPAHSSIHPDGLLILNNARQQQPCEVELVTRDSEGQPMCHGGDRVTANLSYRDIARRSIPVSVRDCQDGTYAISFTPDSAGNMALTLSIRGTPVKGSPFAVCVRTLRPHHGTFHCCSFCSSGGKKHVSCGCGGTMPGGYKGCGHGHTGHPGRRHWSCCGNLLHNSECGRPPSTLYHLTL